MDKGHTPVFTWLMKHKGEKAAFVLIGPGAVSNAGEASVPPVVTTTHTLTVLHRRNVDNAVASLADERKLGLGLSRGQYRRAVREIGK